jgi:hypothetical protein
VLPSPCRFGLRIWAESKMDWLEMIKSMERLQKKNKCLLKNTKYPFVPADKDFAKKFKAFDSKSKNKLAKFLGYLRKRQIVINKMPIDAAMSMPAKYVMNAYFHCVECGEEFCSREEINRLIIESESPERAHLLLKSIIKKTCD